jgi:hypothetical protein
MRTRVHDTCAELMFNFDEIGILESEVWIEKSDRSVVHEKTKGFFMELTAD